MFCDFCGERYREVWRNGRLRPLLYSDDRPHACPGSLREKGLAIREAKKNNHGGNWRKKRKGKKAKAANWRVRRWTASDKSNTEADARLRHLLESA